MVWKIIWSQEALDDLSSIRIYIENESYYYAKKCIETITSETRRLENFPRLGRTVPEYESEYMREIFVYDYRIIYNIEQEEIIKIAAIKHGKSIVNKKDDN